jgi:hypothetical protein
MYRRPVALAASALVVVLSAACSSSPMTAVTGPSPSPTPTPVAPTPPPVQTYTLSGTVFEVTPAGRIPVEGVEVYCDSCGSPDGHTFVHTDAEGFYSLAWTQNGIRPLLVRKAGYAVRNPTRTFPDGTGGTDPLVNGDTKYDFELVRR